MAKQFALSGDSLSRIELKTNDSVLDITGNVTKIQITESLIVPFIRGFIRIIDTGSTDILTRLPMSGGPETSVQFSFSGLEDDGESPQKEIKITHENYRVMEIELGSQQQAGRNINIFFAHKCFFENLKVKTTAHYEDMKISEIVRKISNQKDFKLEWNEIETTQNNVSYTRPLNNPFTHIINLTNYSVRKENINDVNYLFWQDINQKHNYKSLGKLFSQTPTVGKDTDTGFIVAHFQPGDFKDVRRFTLNHTPIHRSSLMTSLSGAHGSFNIFSDPAIKDGFHNETFEENKAWNKQTHMSQRPLVEQNSDYWKYINTSYLTTLLHTNTNGYCCNEPAGGILNPIYCLPRRINQMAKSFQLGIRFSTTGNSDSEVLSAGKMIFFGRPLIKQAPDAKREDVFYSGKYCISTLKHEIFIARNGQKRYSCIVEAYKDSLGDE